MYLHFEWNNFIRVKNIQKQEECVTVLKMGEKKYRPHFLCSKMKITEKFLLKLSVMK